MIESGQMNVEAAFAMQPDLVWSGFALDGSQPKRSILSAYFC